MELRSWAKIIDAAALFTLVLAVMFYFGHEYLVGYLGYFKLRIYYFNVSFYETVTLGYPALLASLVAISLSIITSRYTDRFWDRFLEAKVPRGKIEISKALRIALVLLTIGFSVFVLGLAQQWGGRIAASQAARRLPVKIMTNSSVLLDGWTVIVMKLGGQYVVLRKDWEGNETVHIVPETEVHQIVSER